MKTIAVLFFSFLTYVVQAQQSQFAKFGNVTEGDFQRKYDDIDTGAHAVVLSDIGELSINGNSRSSFSLTLKRHKVIHILDKNGYDEAKFEIPLFSMNKNEERLDDVNAVTYNLENGKIVATKLGKKEILKEKKDKNWEIKKFTLPNVKEGSIIEIEYKVISDFIERVDPWYFQGSSPRLWSEYKFSAPSFFTYSFISRGHQPFAFTNQNDRIGNFSMVVQRSNGIGMVDERINFTSGVTDYRWVMRNVPQLKEESFTSSLKNHISQIELQLVATGEPLVERNYIENWTDINMQLLESENFGVKINSNDLSFESHIDPLIHGASTDLEKAQRIYQYIRDNFSTTDDRNIYCEQSTLELIQTKKGSVAEINLLLTSMLLKAGLAADPVILSTRENGYIYESYPTKNGFNYVITELDIQGKKYYLDASEKRLGFDKLPYRCYNGHARVIGHQPSFVNLSADALVEKHSTKIVLKNNKNGWLGSYIQVPGYYSSLEIRNKIKEKGEEQYFDDIRKAYSKDVILTSMAIDSNDQYEHPLAIRYNLDLRNAGEEILYVEPFFHESLKNPFVSAKRYYPVELPYTIDETYEISIEIPEGYVLDEKIQPMKVSIDAGNSGLFDYSVEYSGTMINIRSVIKINRTKFVPQDYQALRRFFELIAKNKRNNSYSKRKYKTAHLKNQNVQYETASDLYHCNLPIICICTERKFFSQIRQSKSCRSSKEVLFNRQQC